jgi:hypothetical protein
MSANMETNTETNNIATVKKTVVHKPGRTLLIKPASNNFDTQIIETQPGFQTNHHIEKSNSYFVTFSTCDEANNALKQIKDTIGSSIRIKFAHYRIYFKIEGLVDTSDYSMVKTTHSDLVVDQAKCNVLYYRLYRKNNTYLGCGDMTVDTKEGFDYLMNNNGLKNFTLDGINLNGIHFRYTRTTQ